MFLSHNIHKCAFRIHVRFKNEAKICAGHTLSLFFSFSPRQFREHVRLLCGFIDPRIHGTVADDVRVVFLLPHYIRGLQIRVRDQARLHALETRVSFGQKHPTHGDHFPRPALTRELASAGDG